MQAVKLMKKDADEWDRRMGGQNKPSMFDLANMVQEGAVVQPDGTVAPRAGLSQPETQVSIPHDVRSFLSCMTRLVHFQKPEETMGLLEMSRDFWLALFKANQQARLRDDVQRQIAELLRNTGQKYVRGGRNPHAVATPVDAKANRQLIEKLRASPLVSVLFSSGSRFLSLIHPFSDTSGSRKDGSLGQAGAS